MNWITAVTSAGTQYGEEGLPYTGSNLLIGAFVAIALISVGLLLMRGEGA
jgi:hypothetical protein